MTYCLINRVYYSELHFFTTGNKRKTWAPPHPGLPPSKVDLPLVYKKFYMWVCPFLFLNGLLFLLPHMIWKWRESDVLKKTANESLYWMSMERNTKRRLISHRVMRLLVRHIRHHLGHWKLFSTVYVMLETLYFIILIAELYLLEILMGFNFHNYAMEFFNVWQTEPEYRDDFIIS